MAFKMKGPSLLKMVSALKLKKGTKMDPVRSTVGTQKKDPYTKEDYDFLKEQKEERVTSMDYLSKIPRGPVEIENKPSRKEIEESFKIGETREKLEDDAMDSPDAYIKDKMKKK